MIHLFLAYVLLNALLTSLNFLLIMQAKLASRGETSEEKKVPTEETSLSILNT